MISDKGVSLIKEFEGFRSEAYQDVVGIWTIGYGTTKIEGKPIQPGTKCTEDQALLWLREEVEKIAEPFIDKLVKVTLTQNQRDALISFIYNVGSGNFSKSTLLKLLNDGMYTAAAEQFLRWNKAGGKEFPGLTRRRKAEKDLFLS